MRIDSLCIHLLTFAARREKSDEKQWQAKGCFDPVPATPPPVLFLSAANKVCV